MGVKYTTWAWELDLATGVKIVMLALADHANDATGLAWPSVPRLMARTGQSERTVQNSLRTLEQTGLIAEEAPPRQHQSRRYRLVMSKSEAQILHPSKTSGGAEDDTQGRKIRHPGVQELRPNHHELPGTRAQARAADGNGRARSRYIQTYEQSGFWSSSWGPEPDAAEITKFRESCGWTKAL